MLTNIQLKDLEGRLKIVEDNIRKSKIHHLLEWLSITASVVIGIISLSFLWQSLSISNTALKLSKLEKKPSFSYLIQKDKGQYFLCIKNKSKNRATGLLVRLIPKIHDKEKAEIRDGAPIEVPIDIEKIFGRSTHGRYLIDNFYEINKIRKDEKVWLQGEITYKNMETDDWEDETISYIKIEER